jgi:hypothetical protein
VKGQRYTARIPRVSAARGHVGRVRTAPLLDRSVSSQVDRGVDAVARRAIVALPSSVTKASRSVGERTERSRDIPGRVPVSGRSKGAISPSFNRPPLLCRCCSRGQLGKRLIHFVNTWPCRGFLNRGSQVRVLSGTPAFARIGRRISIPRWVAPLAVSKLCHAPRVQTPAQEPGDSQRGRARQS